MLLRITRLLNHKSSRSFSSRTGIHIIDKPSDFPTHLDGNNDRFYIGNLNDGLYEESYPKRAWINNQGRHNLRPIALSLVNDGSTSPLSRLLPNSCRGIHLYDGQQMYIFPSTDGVLEKLQTLLESERIVKVGHDMHFCGYLYGKGIDLQSSYDTQMIYQIIKESDMPYSLPTLIQKLLPQRFQHFGLDEVLTVDSKSVQHFSTVSEKIEGMDAWELRPLPPALMSKAAHSVLHLLDLAHQVKYHSMDESGVWGLETTDATVMQLKSLNYEFPSIESVNSLTPPSQNSQKNNYGNVQGIKGMLMSKQRDVALFRTNLHVNAVMLAAPRLFKIEDVHIGDVIDLELVQPGTHTFEKLPIIDESTPDMIDQRLLFVDSHTVQQMSLSDKNTPFLAVQRMHSKYLQYDRRHKVMINTKALMDQNDNNHRANESFNDDSNENDKEVNNPLKEFAADSIVSGGRLDGGNRRGLEIDLGSPLKHGNFDGKPFLGQKIYRKGNVKIRTKLPVRQTNPFKTE